VVNEGSGIPSQFVAVRFVSSSFAEVFSLDDLLSEVFRRFMGLCPYIGRVADSNYIKAFFCGHGAILSGQVVVNSGGVIKL
jgi:hypothetical protein